MHILKKLPPILSSFAIVITILVSGSANLEINLIAKRIIIVGILFYIIGMVIKYYVLSTISSLQNDELNDNIVIEEDKTEIVLDATSANDSEINKQSEDLNSSFNETFNNQSSEEFVPFGVQNVESINDASLTER